MKLLDNFTDKVDVDFNTSLFEYGIARDPKTGFTIFAGPKLTDNPEELSDYVFDYTVVDFEEVIEDLNEVEQDFFRFIGMTKEEEISNINNDYLSDIIHSLNMYKGLYKQSCTFTYTLKQILNIYKKHFLEKKNERFYKCINTKRNRNN